MDGSLTVREVRAVASSVNDGTDIETALADAGVTLGEVTLDLPVETYLDLRRRASMENVAPGVIVAAALDGGFQGDDQ